jgi:hypothetical protein
MILDFRLQMAELTKISIQTNPGSQQIGFHLAASQRQMKK